VADDRPERRRDAPRDARLVLFRDGYVGLAPVPGGRLNVGIVLGPSWRALLARDGAAGTARRVLEGIPTTDDDPVLWANAAACDRIAGAAPLGGRVSRRAGPGWFVVGDAAGFLDPFTGEGLHRALVSTELAAAAIHAALGRDRARGATAADDYDRAMRRRFATKDAVSVLIQSFLARPRLFEYAARRLADRPALRATIGLVMGDLVPASRGLDPRFLAALLAP
jgi:flavin-dependent dehydrogenase